MDYCIIIHGVHNSNSTHNADTASGLQPRWGLTINQVICGRRRDSEERGAVLSGTWQVQEKKR